MTTLFLLCRVGAYSAGDAFDDAGSGSTSCGVPRRRYGSWMTRILDDFEVVNFVIGCRHVRQAFKAEDRRSRILLTAAGRDRKIRVERIDAGRARCEWDRD